METHKENLANKDVLALSTNFSCCLSRPSEHCPRMSITVVNKMQIQHTPNDTLDRWKAR